MGLTAFAPHNSLPHDPRLSHNMVTPPILDNKRADHRRRDVDCRGVYMPASPRRSTISDQPAELLFV
jgi:hypothetical protein